MPSGQSYINSLRCSSTFRHQKFGLHTLMPPMSLRSGKHNLSAACPKERNTNNQKDRSKNHQQRTPKIIVFLVFMVCFTNVLHGRKFNDTEMCEDKPNMVPTLAQQRPTQTTKSTKMAQHEPNMVPT